MKFKILKVKILGLEYLCHVDKYPRGYATYPNICFPTFFGYD